MRQDKNAAIGIEIIFVLDPGIFIRQDFDILGNTGGHAMAPFHIAAGDELHQNSASIDQKPILAAHFAQQIRHREDLSGRIFTELENQIARNQTDFASRREPVCAFNPRRWSFFRIKDRHRLMSCLNPAFAASQTGSELRGEALTVTFAIIPSYG